MFFSPNGMDEPRGAPLSTPIRLRRRLLLVRQCFGGARKCAWGLALYGARTFFAHSEKPSDAMAAVPRRYCRPVHYPLPLSRAHAPLHECANGPDIAIRVALNNRWARPATQKAAAASNASPEAQLLLPT